MSNFFKIILFCTIFFASVEGFANQDSVEQIYKSVKPKYDAMQSIRDVAKKGKVINYISVAVAVLVFLLFAKFFKLYGVIVALIMIVAGYLVLNRANKAPQQYEELYKRDIVAPFGQGYKYAPSSVSVKDIENSKIFLPNIKNYTIQDSYQKGGVSVAFVIAEFDTKENKSVERFNENKFSGILIKISKPTKSRGVAISEAFRERVADMDIEFLTFFAKGKRAGSREGFDIYGEVADDDFDRVLKLDKGEVAVSFTGDTTYILLYSITDPLEVDILKDFNINLAKKYAKTFADIDRVVGIFE